MELLPEIGGVELLSMLGLLLAIIGLLILLSGRRR